MNDVALRPVEHADRQALFDHMRDPRWVRMAAFTRADGDDRGGFDAWLDTLLRSPDVVIRTITEDGQVVGFAAVFPSSGALEITVSVSPDRWSHGIATRAAALLLANVTDRPVVARAASDNVGSLRVMEKLGFRRTATERAYAHGRGAVVDETILRLDA